MPVTSSGLAAQQWTYLTNLLRTEANPSGRLPTVQAVAKSYQLWMAASPQIGVQFESAVESKLGQRRHLVTTQFVVVVGVQSKANPANLDDAMAQVMAIVEDENTLTHGIAPILRDTATYGLGGRTITSGITKIETHGEVKPGASAEIWAYCDITFVTTTEVAI